MKKLLGMILITVMMVGCSNNAPNTSMITTTKVNKSTEIMTEQTTVITATEQNSVDRETVIKELGEDYDPDRPIIYGVFGHLFSKTKLRGFISAINGDTIIEQQYTDVYDFFRGYALVENRTDTDINYYIIDEHNNPIIKVEEDTKAINHIRMKGIIFYRLRDIEGFDILYDYNLNILTDACVGYCEDGYYAVADVEKNRCNIYDIMGNYLFSVDVLHYGDDFFRFQSKGNGEAYVIVRRYSEGNSVFDILSLPDGKTIATESSLSNYNFVEKTMAEEHQENLAKQNIDEYIMTENGYAYCIFYDFYSAAKNITGKKLRYHVGWNKIKGENEFFLIDETTGKMVIEEQPYLYIAGPLFNVDNTVKAPFIVIQNVDKSFTVYNVILGNKIVIENNESELVLWEVGKNYLLFMDRDYNYSYYNFNLILIKTGNASNDVVFR